MKKISILLSVFGGAMFLTCGASAAPATPAQSCFIEGRASAGILTVRGIVTGKPKGSGLYTFAISKSGPSGTSDSRQGGEYVMPASGRVVAGEAQFNVERGTRVRAVMTVRRAGKTVTCRQSYPA